MFDLVKKMEHWINRVLIVMLVVVVVLATVELGHDIVSDIAAPPVLFPGIDKLLDLFGKVLLVVIGLELVETLRTFAADGLVRIEVVLTVAMIALCRKIILLEPGHTPSLTLLGVAALIAALSFAYRVFVRGRRALSA
jgi:uncharacterized membrane protein (DUF373 family)